MSFENDRRGHDAGFPQLTPPATRVADFGTPAECPALRITVKRDMELWWNSCGVEVTIRHDQNSTLRC